MVKPSFRVLFSEIADEIFVRLPQAFLLLATFSRTWSLFLSIGWRGAMPPGAFLPSLCPHDPLCGALFPRELGPVGFYYGLASRWFDLGEWVCFPLLVLFTVGRGCFLFRLGFGGGFWFLAFRPAFSSPCSF